MTDDELGRLGKVSLDYQRKVGEFEAVLVAAAEAEAEHKSARAQRILLALASETRMSHARAETIAEADDKVAELHRTRLITQAKAEAHRAHLAQLKEQVANGRTFAASAREVDRIHAEGRGGA